VTKENILKIRKIEQEKDDLILKLQGDINKLQSIIMTLEHQVSNKSLQESKSQGLKNEMKNELENLSALME
jgi:cob(I)alamin adenosyltransferase